ncbi:flagellar hook-length control protein FliK [Nitrospirillum amazonense]|uniref:Flagellar hook-length control protein FliK n=1 Tax=Nitrospirillum amazonense TaxID=28077 RepID=A0A560K8R9_9PROT|nr:flagellar hook-length control protein FliK [Nitrospirillum amazonense]MDG3441777.1 flagellar hook-length control protein FliK [Nitrospirillum amazonense]TWB79731.1 flagellar hook-length control protein FliK [Nitrospirillum amazonense]
MTGFQSVQSLFPTQGTTASGLLGGTAAGGEAADLFTQLLSGMVDASTVNSQSAGQSGAFLTAGQGTGGANGAATTSPFTPSTIPFALGKGGVQAKGGPVPASTTTGTAVTALMTGITANTPSALQPATGWTQTHWSAKTVMADVADGATDGQTATDTQDSTATDTTLAALATAMGGQQQPTPPVPAAQTAAGQMPSDAIKADAATDATAASQAVAGQTVAQAGTAQADAIQANTAKTDAVQIGAPQAGASQTGAMQMGASQAGMALPGMTPVAEPTAADAALAAQAIQPSPAQTAKGSAASAAASSLAVADQKAAALAAGTPPVTSRASTAAPPANGAPTQVQSAQVQAVQTQAAQTQAAKAQTGTVADATALAATAAATATDGATKTGKADGVAASGSGLKTGAPKGAKGDMGKPQGATVTATTLPDQKSGATTADQARQQTADSATDDSSSNGVLAAPADNGMIYADAHAAAAPLAKVGDAATPAATAPMAALANAAGNGNAAANTATSAQATLQALLQQQQAGRTNTASNGLLATTENGLLPAATDGTSGSASASDAALNASGFMGLVDGQHTFPTGFAAQMAGTAQAARPAQYPPVLQQVTMGFQKAASNGMDSVTIQLTPDDMGSIDVKLDFHKDGKVRASVTADNAKTLDLLQRNSDDLKTALQDAGLQTDNDSLSFNLKDDSQAQQQQERRGGQNGAQFSMDDTAAPEEAASEDTIIPSLGRVDVRI